MTPASVLIDLAERCERASGADRELDCEIHVAVLGWTLTKVGEDIDGKNACEIYTECGELIEGFAYPTRGAISPYYHVPHDANYSASLDAAVSLCERVLPDFHLTVTGVNKAWSARVGSTADLAVPISVWANAATPALSLIAATLRALAAPDPKPKEMK